MKKNRPDYELRESRRFLALLIIALLISCYSQTGNTHFQQAPPPKQKLIWLRSNNENPPAGIWQVQEKTDTKSLYSLVYKNLPPFFVENKELPPFSTVLLSPAHKRLMVNSTHPKLTTLVFKPLPLNRADKESLAALSGVGPTLAEKIVIMRKNIGRYDSLSQLMQIKGIGRHSFESIRPQLTLD